MITVHVESEVNTTSLDLSILFNERHTCVACIYEKEYTFTSFKEADTGADLGFSLGPHRHASRLKIYIITL